MNTRFLLAILLGLITFTGIALAGGDPARGQELSVECMDCHGEKGQGDEEVSGIAGLDESYLIEQLKAYKTGERVDEEFMAMTAEELTDQDIADLAAYYAALERNQ